MKYFMKLDLVIYKYIHERKHLGNMTVESEEKEQKALKMWKNVNVKWDRTRKKIYNKQLSREKKYCRLFYINKLYTNHFLVSN